MLSAISLSTSAGIFTAATLPDAPMHTLSFPSIKSGQSPAAQFFFAAQTDPAAAVGANRFIAGLR